MLPQDTAPYLSTLKYYLRTWNTGEARVTSGHETRASLVLRVRGYGLRLMRLASVCLCNTWDLKNLMGVDLEQTARGRVRV